MKQAVFVEHTPGGGPGYLDLLFGDKGIGTTTVQAHKSGITGTEKADFLILMGSDQPVKKMPWYDVEIQLIQQHLQLKKPIMGVCAGAELIALAKGGKLIRLKHREYGWTPVTSPLGSSWVFEWHEDAFKTPAGAHEIVTGADGGMCQAYRGPGYLGTQFHPEMTARILDDWTNKDPAVSATASHENALRLLSSQRLAGYLVNLLVGPKCACGAGHHPHVIARPYGGANLDLNRKEYLMARVLQDALEQIARRINDQAGSAREALAGFDTARRDVTGPAFRTQIEHHVQQTVQMGTENAQRLLVAARERQWHRRHGAAGKKSTPFVPPLPSVSPQLMTPWSKLVKGITDHTVQHFDRIADDFKDRLTDTLKDGYQNGESAAQLGTRVKEALGVDRNRANERARTMTIETYNQAHIIQYQEAGASGVEWSAAEDERECDYCADLDGSVWALDDPDLIRPPAHSNCRCVLLPVLDDIPDDAPQPSQDTVDFCQDWRENYFDIPLYAPS